MKKSNLILTLSWVIAILTLLMLVVSMNKFGVLTGEATSTDTGTANLTIESNALIEFTVDNVNWSSGYVNDTALFAVLDTEGNVVNGTNWLSVTQGLVIENKGNVNLSLNISSSANATTFICDGTPCSDYTESFKWKVTNNETDSCLGGTEDAVGNDSAYHEVSTTEVLACANFGYGIDADTILMDLEVTIPSDAVGTKGVVLTAEGTTL